MGYQAFIHRCALVVCLSPLTVFASVSLADTSVTKEQTCDVMLAQKDFDAGTYVISSPGVYCLKEDIAFNPNSLSYLRRTLPEYKNISAYESGYPLSSQLGFGEGKYNPAAYGLGFFAAIAVASPDVIIDLKGHTLEQSQEHALVQRFFALIETADRPFISGQGPHDFGDSMISARNLTIKNGRLGRSSHHGIHGNGSQNVTIRDVAFDGFEVAAVAMNGVQGLKLENLSASSRTDVPVNGKFSSAQFIKHYVNYLVDSGADVTINGQSPAQIKARLKQAINNVYEDIVVSGHETIRRSLHRDEWRLFHNPQKVVDGNAYGFLINGLGAAVDKFPLVVGTSEPSRDVWFKNVHVKSLKANVTEVVGLAKSAEEFGVVNDPVGSVFQILAVDPIGLPLMISSVEDPQNAHYVGNVVSDAQALVAKAAAMGLFPSFLDTSRNSITPELISWIESKKPLYTYLKRVKGVHPTGFICNGDQMHHVNKGVIGFKLDGAYDVTLEDSSVSSTSNSGSAGSKLCGEYVLSHPKAHLPGYGGAEVRGVSIAGSSHVNVRNFKALDLRSKAGSAVGIDLINDSSEVFLEDVTLDGLSVKESANAKPNANPASIGVRVGEYISGAAAVRCCAYRLKGYDAKEMLDLSGKAEVLEMCSH